MCGNSSADDVLWEFFACVRRFVHAFLRACVRACMRAGMLTIQCMCPSDMDYLLVHD